MAEPSPAPPRPPRSVVVQGVASADAAVGLPCTGVLSPCSRGPVSPGSLVVEEGGPTGATLEVWWNKTTPVGTRSRVEVRVEGALLADAEGASPLALVLDPAALAAPTEVWVLFTPATGSAAYGEDAHLVLSVRYG